VYEAKSGGDSIGIFPHAVLEIHQVTPPVIGELLIAVVQVRDELWQYQEFAYHRGISMALAAHTTRPLPASNNDTWQPTDAGGVAHHSATAPTASAR